MTTKKTKEVKSNKTSNAKKSSKRDSVKSLRKKIDILNIKISEQGSEIERISDKNIRLLAEFDNYKRRTQEDRNRLFKYAGEDLAKASLPVLDDLQRILDTDDKSNDKAIIEGIELIVSKMKKIFEDQGIIPFDSIGQDFDAEFHEALMSENSDKGENIILKEFEKGYKYNDKILRHAKVVVSKS